MVEEDDLYLEFKDGYCCPFCGFNPIDHEHVVKVRGVGEFDEVLCDACGETLAYQKTPEDED